jgi:hypothetical protein
VVGHRHRQLIAARAQQNQQPEAADNEPEKPNYSEGVFLLRLLVLSFAGALHVSCHAAKLTHHTCAYSGQVTANPAATLAVCVHSCYLASAGAALVKYGELLLGEVPFSHNLGLALTMVIGPCLVFSAILAARFRP